MYYNYPDDIDEIMNRDPSTPPDLRRPGGSGSNPGQNNGSGPSGCCGQDGRPGQNGCGSGSSSCCCCVECEGPRGPQ